MNSITERQKQHLRNYQRGLEISQRKRVRAPSGDLRVRLEERNGRWFVYQVDRSGRRVGSGIPATVMEIALWQRICEMEEAVERRQYELAV